MDTFYSADLAGVEVGETSISDVNGELGRLTYRGHPIDTLVQKPFWQVVWLVLFGDYPTVSQESKLQSFMAVHSSLNKPELTLLRSLSRDLHPMLMLQGVLPLLEYDLSESIDGVSDDAHRGLFYAGKIPSLIAATRQLEIGNEPIKPNIDAAFHENFLMMFNGQAASAAQVQILDTTQILQMEHSFNASTFAGRVCASTLAPIQSALVASIATLSGALHGGADQAAIEMAESIGSAQAAEIYVQECLAGKTKIMGMGHREYRVVDPRATVLKPMAKNLCSEGAAKQLFETLAAVEDACQREFAKKDRQIHANVEFYKGAVFYQLGIPARYFTSLFAMARVYGYIAHYLEFSKDNRLIRPRARYVGA